MTAYGQSIAPKWYQETDAKRMSKMGFAHILHRALMQVGMIPLRAINPFDLEKLANAEYPVTTDRDDLVFHYDFPTSETWSVGGVTYRPVLIMHIGSVAGQIPVNVGEVVGSSILFHLAYRRSDRIQRNDIFNLQRLHTGMSNFGLGTAGENTSPTASGTPANGAYGMYLYFSTWKMYEGASDVNRPDYLTVKNIHVILGRGGLSVMVGSGTGKSDCNDIFSFSIVFAGARIPSRGRIAMNDSNLNLTCPVFAMPHQTTVNVTPPAYWSNSHVAEGVSLTAVHPCTWLLGVQHDLKVLYGDSAAALAAAAPGAVLAHLYNLENIERPLMPVANGDTKNSPRVVSGAPGGAHILQRIAYIPWNAWNNADEYIGIIDAGIRAQPCPGWEDVWTAPNYRFGDLTAPYGEYVDPVTSTNWFLFRASGVGMMVATQVEGITKYAKSDLGYFSAETLTQTDYYNLNGGFTWVNPSPHDAVALNNGGGSTLWIPTASTDEALLTSPADGDYGTFEFTAEPYTIGAAVRFTLQMELKWNSVSAQSGNNPMIIQWSPDNGTTWTTLQSINNVGTTGGNWQNYTATAEFDIHPGTIDGKFRFRVQTQFTTGTGGTKTGGIRAIRLRQYTRT